MLNCFKREWGHWSIAWISHGRPVTVEFLLKRTRELKVVRRAGYARIGVHTSTHQTVSSWDAKCDQSGDSIGVEARAARRARRQGGAPEGTASTATGATGARAGTASRSALRRRAAGPWRPGSSRSIASASSPSWTTSVAIIGELDKLWRRRR